MAVALERFKQNPRVRAVRLAVPADACPVCQGLQGTYDKNQAPHLPIEGCSNHNGCCSYYEPLLDEIYP